MNLDLTESVSNRRSLFYRGGTALGVLVVALVLATCGGDDDGSGAQDIESDTVVITDYGGTTRDARAEAFYRPFSDETGVQVVSADADPAKLQLFAENERAEWDMIDLDGWDMARLVREGLIEKLPPEVPRNKLIPEEFQDYAIAGYVPISGIGYRTDEGPAPKSWEDFFDTERFPGKRALPSFAFLPAEAALLADGVPCDQLYPLDLDRAFDKLDEIRDDLLFWDSFGQGIQMLAQGSARMVLNTGARVTLLKDQGLPVDFVANNGLRQWSALGIPKYAPHPDAAYAMADLMAQAEPQAQFSRLTYYGPTNPEAFELLNEATLERLPNSPEYGDVACDIDVVALSKQIDEYSKRYSEWLAQG